MHSYISFDTETTGVDFNSSQVIQCGAIFLNSQMQPIVKKSWNVNYVPEKFTWDMEAENIHKISKDEAMKHGVGIETFLKEFEQEVIKNFGLEKKEVHVIAANAYFDYLMFERLWSMYRPNEECPISRRVVDLSSLGLTIIGDAGMSTLLEKLGIPYDDNKQHDALYDAELHLKVFHSLATIAQQDGIIMH